VISRSALHFACSEGHYEIVSILIESSCDINSSDSHGKTPLYYSTENGYYEVIELLIQNHCDINVVDENDNII